MNRLKPMLLIVLLLLLSGSAVWFALRSRRSLEPPNLMRVQPTPPVAKTRKASADAFHAIISAKAGQVTAGDIAKHRGRLLNRSPESRATLERGLRSEDPFERLVAFRLLLELDGWTPALSAIALQDSFVLLRVEAADWLYLAWRFQEWDTFLFNASENAPADYASLKPAVQHLNWRDLPAGVEILGMGYGIDRYFREILRRSDSAASLAVGDLFSAATPAEKQLALLRLLHAASRPDYETLLRNTLSRANEDTPVRYEAVWLLGQAFATQSSRELLTQHLATNATDPLKVRIEQSLAIVVKQLTLGADHLAWLETQVAVASTAVSRADYGAALIGYLDEASRLTVVTNKVILQEAKRTLPAQGFDYAARRRLADIEYLMSRNN